MWQYLHSSPFVVTAAVWNRPQLTALTESMLTSLGRSCILPPTKPQAVPSPHVSVFVSPGVSGSEINVNDSEINANDISTLEGGSCMVMATHLVVLT
jgi:hypothetical protein